MELKMTVGERNKLKWNVEHASALSAVDSTTVLNLIADIDTTRAALEATNAQIVADEKSLAMETAMKVKGSACYWEEFMSPAWVEAKNLLSR
jgi:hypothetical protein